MKQYTYSIALVLILVFMRVSGAAPGVHVLFAQLWMEKHGRDTEHQEDLAFIAGTLFPDIRYLGTLDRKETHIKHVTLASMRSEKNAFSAGLRLHSYVDEQREAFVKKYKIKKRLKGIPKKRRVLFLKVLEDEILWDRLQTERALLAMEKIYKEEIAAGADLPTIEKWHQEMDLYFRQRPSMLLQSLAREEKPFISLNAQEVSAWACLIPLYAREEVFMLYANEMIALVSQKF